MGCARGVIAQRKSIRVVALVERCFQRGRIRQSAANALVGITVDADGERDEHLAAEQQRQEPDQNQ